MTESTDKKDPAPQARDEGPGDFVEVAAVDDLGDGEMAGFELEGERVLLARVDGEFYAINGICSHERANLDGGALYEHAVYCPLHYSSFDVRSGEVLSPPADRSIPAYRVKVENGKVLVCTRLARDEPDAGGEPGEAGAGDEITYEPLRQAGAWHARIGGAIDSMGWLQRLSDWLTKGVAPARSQLARTGLLDLVHGRWFGHSLHPVMSDLPIGFWASSLLLYAIGQGKPAAILSVAGIATALGTVATGAADWSIADGHERRAGLLHGLLMTGAVVVQAGSAAAYYFTDAGDAVLGLSAASFAVTVGGAYLGGHLVLGLGTMVNHASWPSGPAQWTRAVAVAELDAEAAGVLAVDVDGQKVLLHRNDDGHISAIHNACSHAGAPLSLGKVCDGAVTCPWHGSVFRLLDGSVVRGPATHPQPAFRVRLRDGWIEVRSS